MEEARAVHPELVAIKILDVALHRHFSCPRLTPPKHLKALCSLWSQTSLFMRVFSDMRTAAMASGKCLKMLRLGCSSARATWIRHSHGIPTLLATAPTRLEGGWLSRDHQGREVCPCVWRVRHRDDTTPARLDENCGNVLSCKMMATDAHSVPLPWTSMTARLLQSRRQAP